MRLGVPRETTPGERRVAATPESVGRLVSLGFDVAIETGAGLHAGWDDETYTAAGARVADAGEVWASAIVAKVRAPTGEQVGRLGSGQTLISFLHPAGHPDLIAALAARGASAIAMDRVPRTTRAQKVDALSSTANLSGYRAVIEAVHVLQRPLGGQTTAAGRIAPCTVLVIGAGVAGLAAIGTARSLGAIVRAFDTRPAVREQIASMGAEFLEVSIEEDGTGQGGYAREMSPAFIAAEMALFAEQARAVDVIIATALIPGRRAPVLVTSEMVASMRRGSVIVDLAAEMGGNCERTVPGEAVEIAGVTIIGYTDLPSRLATQASTLYATNVVNLVEEMGGAARFAIDDENDIVRPMAVVRHGEVLAPPPLAAQPPQPAAPATAGATAGPVAAMPAQAARSSHRVSHGPPIGPPGRGSWLLLGAAGLALALVGAFAPAGFLTHLTVFVLACVVGYQVVWSVTPALHTPLMSVTNAISGIIIVGGMLQIGGGTTSAAGLLGLAAVFVAMINVAGGFLVTQRMLKMFHR
ncbi:MAG TPA: Re/Si-specific NAD(P)(+) transhydrogenase subunit alpha [Vicinamibacterales bacterium]|nr:Re/Si-specific NAD(P)(+) transhydrogenase subunit alpha [Vicinamibacterales bacterium]